MTAKNTFGALLRSFREAAKMTLKDVSMSMDWSIVYLSDIERGRRNPPSAADIQKLAAIIGCSQIKLLDQANRDRDRIEILLSDNKHRTANDAALTLARRWTELTEDQLADIMKIIKENED